ncbi:hypothetical protein [Thermoplasma acidophilum]|uniref:hypothetical protein n=1 Tax=Thermoplasma acidophilum TaxID=2303 RepID=UPI00064F06AB|nr:hypothetical protein [Thermoplasma acidophilum]MCY0851332.1 hypothetical protein [Thermoplasma acidophilum]
MMAARSKGYGAIISVVIVFLFSLILAYAGYWYMIIVPSAVAGLFVSKLGRIAAYSLLSPVGVLVAMSPHLAYGIKQASLFSAVAGIPGGPAFPLIILIAMSYLFAMLPMAAVSSFFPEKTQ